MPILRKAKQVSLIAVEGHIVPGPSVKEAVAHLQANGIPATDKTVTPTRSRPGEAILAEAAAVRGGPLAQGRVYAKPAAADDLRRRHPPHPERG
jgi:hypothetical protein